MAGGVCHSGSVCTDNSQVVCTGSGVQTWCSSSVAVGQVELPRERIDLDGHKEEMMESLSEAWVFARKNIEKSQKAQKRSYDRKTKEPAFKQGELEFVYMPKEKASKAYKFARPFYGPYRVVEVLETGLVVRPVDRPEGEIMWVACNRVRRCPDPVPDKEFWSPDCAESE